jgi:uncharacterized membrane protein
MRRFPMILSLLLVAGAFAVLALGTLRKREVPEGATTAPSASVAPTASCGKLLESIAASEKPRPLPVTR